MNTRDELLEKVLYEARTVSGTTKLDEEIKTEFDEIYDVFNDSLLNGLAIDMWHNLGVHGRMDNGYISLRHSSRFGWSGTYNNEFWCHGENPADVLGQIENSLRERVDDAMRKLSEAVVAVKRAELLVDKT